MSTTFNRSRKAPNPSKLFGIALSLLMASTSPALHAAQTSGLPAYPEQPSELDRRLEIALCKAGFKGQIEASLETRLGRPVDGRLADLGRRLLFDPLGGLHNDNTCAGCHAPSAGFGETQSIAIGVQSNRIVGPGRVGPRNQRRTPTVVNTAF